VRHERDHRRAGQKRKPDRGRFPRASVDASREDDRAREVPDEQHRVLRDGQTGRPEGRGIETRSRFAEQIPSPSERIAEQPG
jgi:hypothetical protein